MFVYVFKCVCVFKSVYVHSYVSMCVFLCTRTRACMRLGTFTCARVCSRARVCVRVYVWELEVFVYINAYSLYANHHDDSYV